jgi:hypothetical protein
MADKAQLKILRKGVTAWNRWRNQNPKVKVDLRRANLREAQLIEADLREADLRYADAIFADLTGANLFKADLREAQLLRAGLSGSDLRKANLRGADLLEANLTGAHLTESDLGGANLSGAILDRADLTDSNMAYTMVVDLNLSVAKGLETVKHVYPSTVGIDTIYRSKGNIPKAFLRGAGVPENFIALMKSLAGTPTAFEYYSCFISYSSEDEKFAQRLYADLQRKGVRCWFAPEDLKIGDRFRERIDEAVRLYDKLLLVLSETSIESLWVEDEVEAALEKERRQKRLVLFPIRLDDAVMRTSRAWAGRVRRIVHMGDFRDWRSHDSYKKAFSRLLRDLRGEDKPKRQDGGRHRP